MKLKAMPHYEESMQRIESWFRCEKLDRAPVQFRVHAPHNINELAPFKPWTTKKEKWMDAHWHAERMLKIAENTKTVGETFPMWWPDLGPNVYAAFYRGEITFGDNTSWINHPAKELNEILCYQLDWENEYLKAIDIMTQIALQYCQDAFIVGFTDLHPGMDCLADWRDPQELCLDFYDDPDAVPAAAEKASADFGTILNHFHMPLEKAGQPSVNWMRIPVKGRLHVPSCDFSALISTEIFDEYCLPLLKKEMQFSTHNIYHLDGKDALRHLPTLLAQPEIHAIQWQQGTGSWEEIMQWVPVIKTIQEAGKGVLVHLKKRELKEFMAAVPRQGIYLSVLDSESVQEEEELMRLIEKWR